MVCWLNDIIIRHLYMLALQLKVNWLINLYDRLYLFQVWYYISVMTAFKSKIVNSQEGYPFNLMTFWIRLYGNGYIHRQIIGFVKCVCFCRVIASLLYQCLNNPLSVKITLSIMFLIRKWYLDNPGFIMHLY